MLFSDKEGTTSRSIVGFPTQQDSLPKRPTRSYNRVDKEVAVGAEPGMAVSGHLPPQCNLSTNYVSSRYIEKNKKIKVRGVVAVTILNIQMHKCNTQVV